MSVHRYLTLDVFTSERFGGNPLAIFPEAEGLTAQQMQALATELNLSETVFILPPHTVGNTARIRIFTPRREIPFAGHPSLGAGYLLAVEGAQGTLQLELEAGIVNVYPSLDDGCQVVGASIDAPRPLTVGREMSVKAVADAIGVRPDAIILSMHGPIRASVGIEFILVEIEPEALAEASPNAAAFERLAAVDDSGFASIHMYSRSGARVDARMFAPLDGIPEDPATGSANAALAAYLLSLTNNDSAEFRITQGTKMGRPSELHASALRERGSIRARVGGSCVPVFRGEICL